MLRVDKIKYLRIFKNSFRSSGSCVSGNYSLLSKDNLEESQAGIAGVLLGLKDIVQVSLNRRGELEHYSLVSNQKQILATDLERLEVKEVSVGLREVSLQMRGDKLRQFTLDNRPPSGSTLELLL